MKCVFMADVMMIANVSDGEYDYLKNLFTA